MLFWIFYNYKLMSFLSTLLLFYSTMEGKKNVLKHWFEHWNGDIL
jgi:hypothetical protein